MTEALEAVLRGEPAPLSRGEEVDAELRELRLAVDRVVAVFAGASPSADTAAPQRFVAGHDPLTGLFNRPHFEDELARLEKDRQFPVSVILAGLDEPSSIAGGMAADRLVCAAARVFREGVRGGDVVARYGGDTFAVLLLRADAATAARVLERIREGEMEYNRNAPGLPLGFSIGLATALTSGSMADARRVAEQNMKEDRVARRR